MRVYLMLLEGARPDDLLFLQVKQAGPSVYEAFLEPSRYPNHGQRVTVGRRFIQSSTDILVGWTTVQGIDFYVRKFRDMKVIPSGEQVTPWLRQFARKCGLVLARAHATTGDAAAIDAYLGKGQMITLGQHRELTVKTPDGQVMTTGPPSRRPEAGAAGRPPGERTRTSRSGRQVASIGRGQLRRRVRTQRPRRGRGRGLHQLPPGGSGLPRRPQRRRWRPRRRGLAGGRPQRRLVAGLPRPSAPAGDQWRPRPGQGPARQAGHRPRDPRP